MSMNRWDPLRDMVTLREAMSNLLEDSFVAPRPSSLMSGAGNLALDVHENAGGFVVTAALPGVNPEDVDINVLGNTVRIHGEFKPQGSPAASETAQGQDTVAQGQPGQGRSQTGRWLVRERRYGAFDRVITLPTAVKAEEAQAQFENGVLTLTLPKVEEAKPRAIKINVRPAITGTATETTPSSDSQS